MAGKAAIVAFVLSLVGLTYQMMSYGLAYLIDNRYNYNNYYSLNAYFSIFAIVVGFWASSHLLESRDSQRITWPAIILALGTAILGNLIIAWSTPSNIGILGAVQMPPADIVVTLIPSPLLLILGSILGFVAARHPQP
jgi:hypothetical protein